MKRMIVAAAMAVLLAAAPAQAAVADPVKALKAKLGTGKGVTFTDVTSLLEDSKKTTFLRRKGKLQFDKSGVVASDITTDHKKHTGGLFDDMRPVSSGRSIWVGGKVYSTDPMVGSVPKGKKWGKDLMPMPGGFSGVYSQVVNPAEPATLKALLKGERNGRTYSGKISYSDLAKVSPWFRAAMPLSRGDTAVISYRLTLDARNLPQRLVAAHLAAIHVLEGVDAGDSRFSTETRYSGWGSRVRITAPRG
ncbi:hypothetical protein ITP53_06580 [Nonomuraea sp. K274]|uniref:Outer membrane lipoprotein-sorting protein n=1 Tax=Nonomuraea cypriaca TaxID=1187855 RepID=A0A931EZP0_9ACTN|nr:hypothetical protein [Nonomuraea cypriaca]MBF8185408.1 hypothetical protein [Nonomuraea cypriaca]